MRSEEAPLQVIWKWSYTSAIARLWKWIKLLFMLRAIQLAAKNRENPIKGHESAWTFAQFTENGHWDYESVINCFSCYEQPDWLKKFIIVLIISLYINDIRTVAIDAKIPHAAITQNSDTREKWEFNLSNASPSYSQYTCCILHANKKWVCVFSIRLHYILVQK